MPAVSCRQLKAIKNMADPFLGFGLGLRTDHFQYVLEHQPDLDWFEITSENFMVPGGKPRYYLQAIG